MEHQEEYLERVQQRYGEGLVAQVCKLYDASYHQLLDKLIYPRNGPLPYLYESRMGCRTILLAYSSE
jgi:hypothetical protein